MVQENLYREAKESIDKRVLEINGTLEKLRRQEERLFHYHSLLKQNQQDHNHFSDRLQFLSKVFVDPQFQTDFNGNIYINPVFATEDFSYARKVAPYRDEIDNEVTWGIRLFAGEIQNPGDATDYPIYCRDPVTGLFSQEIRNLKLEIIHSPRGKKYPPECEIPSVKEIGLEVILDRYKKLGVIELLFPEIEMQFKMIYQESDEAIFERIRKKNREAEEEGLRALEEMNEKTR